MAPRPVGISLEASNQSDAAHTSLIDVTGPASADKAIFFIFDIFGYFPQTLQGADILATSDKDQPYQVFMPDFFDGKAADIAL